jgi:NAD(P)-dependent dehydrogenase (short-subunit alcohol dehydrogenase family)
MPMDELPLKNKVALVTGGSRGIGAGITRKLASWGASVCINYVDREGPAKEIAAELEGKGSRVSLYRGDLSDPAQISSMMNDIAAEYGDLHILIHNAAATKFTHFLDATIDQWDFVLNTNARSTWLLAQKALPIMRGRPGGRFITITNSMNQKVSPKAGLFAAAKSALEMTTQYLSYELARYGIVTNCVRPGLVRTSVFKVRPDFEDRVQQELSVSPWKDGLMTTPENSADAVALLCLDEASWISGQIITVDGGYKWWGSIGRRARTS